jgi:hypothetical protein
MYTKNHYVKIIGLKYLLILGFLIWTVGLNSQASASGLRICCFDVVKTASSQVLMGGLQSVNLAVAKHADINFTSIDAPLLLGNLLNQSILNFALAEQPKLFGEGHNRTTFPLSSILKM